MDIKSIYAYFLAAGMTPAGAAGVMGNMQAESAFRSDNVEDRSALSDSEYTAAVDNGTYTDTRFAFDALGYGYFQHTYFTRKRALLAFVRSRGVSISDPTAQLDFALLELKNDFPAVWQICTSTDSVAEASNAFMRQFENPADQSDGALAYRAGLGLAIYERFKGSTLAAPEPQADQEPEAGNVYGREYNLPLHQLGLECHGPEVEALQLLLTAWGYNPGEPSGHFSESTREAVVLFQQSAGLQADGIVGRGTMSRLMGVN